MKIIQFLITSVMVILITSANTANIYADTALTQPNAACPTKFSWGGNNIGCIPTNSACTTLSSKDCKAQTYCVWLKTPLPQQTSQCVHKLQEQMATRPSNQSNPFVKDFSNLGGKGLFVHTIDGSEDSDQPYLPPNGAKPETCNQVSFSALRVDHQFIIWGYGGYPGENNPGWGYIVDNDVNVLCTFPRDGNTDGRCDRGKSSKCSDHGIPTDENPGVCPQVFSWENDVTAEKALTRFPDSVINCYFDCTGQPPFANDCLVDMLALAPVCRQTKTEQQCETLDLRKTQLGTNSEDNEIVIGSWNETDLLAFFMLVPQCYPQFPSQEKYTHDYNQMKQAAIATGKPAYFINYNKIGEIPSPTFSIDEYFTLIDTSITADDLAKIPCIAP